MNFKKSLSSLIATVSLLAVATVPVVSISSEQQAKADDTSYSFPEGTIFKADGTVFAYTNKDPFVFLYTFNGPNSAPKLNSRNVANGSEWYTDEFRIYNHTKYYRVSTNEWLKYTGYTFLEGDDNL
jgi:hypothetical protein